ncbi:MAG: hypothetical protein ACTS3F_08635 [Phycisphaerales bacterium]
MLTVRMSRIAAGIMIASALAGVARSAYIIEIDIDGLDDGAIVYNPDFSFGGDTTTASSSIACLAYGMTGGDSIFGGNGTAFPDHYSYRYSPFGQPDNIAIPAGTPLGQGNTATGAPGGVAGVYRVYAAWPFTQTVSGGPVQYTVATPGDLFQVSIDQNNQGDEWVLLGEITYAGGHIVVTQRAGTNTFVSMRSAGVLFERVGLAPLCPPDLDADNTVDSDDLAILLGAFGCVAPGCPGDIDQDGDVDSDDLGILLSAFGTNCQPV